MNEREMVLLGLFHGVSKKTNKPFKMAYFYSKDDSTNALGYKPYTFFVGDDVNFTESDLLKKFVVQYVYAGGQYVFVQSKRV